MPDAPGYFGEFRRTYFDDIDMLAEDLIDEILPDDFRSKGRMDVPEGMSQSEFDDAVKEAGENYPVGEIFYDADDGSNSNTYVDDVIEGAGLVMPNVRRAIGQNWGESKPPRLNNQFLIHG